MNCRKCEWPVSTTSKRCPMCDRRQWSLGGVTGDGLGGKAVIAIVSVLVILILGVAIYNTDFENIFGSGSRSNHELVGEWDWVDMNILWYRFYEDGSAVNLNDGERFTWYEDGSINAIFYESWSINNDVLTITWDNGMSFRYSRAD